MDEMKVVLRAIETLRPDLPNLVGANWPEFQTQLNAYLDQFQQNPDRSPILRAHILALFGRHRQAHHRLIELIAGFQEEAPLSVAAHRGHVALADRLLAAAPAPEPAGERRVTRYTDIVCPHRVRV